MATLLRRVAGDFRRSSGASGAVNRAVGSFQSGFSAHPRSLLDVLALRWHAGGGGAHGEGRRGLRRRPEAAHALPPVTPPPICPLSLSPCPVPLIPLPLLPTPQASTLVVAEHTGRGAGGSAAALKPPTLSAVAAARKLGGPVAVLVAGSGDAVADVAAAVAKIEGVDEVITTESPALDHALPEPLAALLTNLATQRSFSHVLAASSTFSRNVLPRVAALLDTAMVSDVVEIVDEKTFVRPIYAGNALATVQCSTPSSAVPSLLTIRATSFPASSSSEPTTAPKTTPFDFQGPPAEKSSWVGQELRAADRPDLGSAKVVIAGGRGLKSEENFKLLEQLADKLGGAVGASRAAVDAGYVANDLQVGQTGKIVAPDLYMAFGISGAIQHLAGMKDSKAIVAVNKDPDAPIFQVTTQSTLLFLSPI
ncbi:unnamed protein product [Closterium sp. NIES-65]|nr:unnamed protein product [Closterium sp. NIES-65]